MFNLQEYERLKTKGLINKVEKTNTTTPEALTYAVYVKKYELDGAVVVQLPDEVITVTEQDLSDRVEALRAEIASIEAFKADATNGH